MSLATAIKRIAGSATDPHSDPTAYHELVQRVTAYRTRQKELEGLGHLLADTIAKRDKAELEADLGDATKLDEIARLQVLAGMLPRRQAHLETTLEQEEEALLIAGHEFISKALGPRLRDLEARARAAIRAKMSELFNEEGLELDTAVAKSALVREICGIEEGATIQHKPYFGTFKYLDSLLEKWRQADAFARKL